MSTAVERVLATILSAGDLDLQYEGWEGIMRGGAEGRESGRKEEDETAGAFAAFEAEAAGIL